MAWYKREDREDELSEEKRSVPAGVFTKCPGCRAALLTADLEKNDMVCPQCEHHFPMTAARRLQLILDPDSFVEADATMESVDPLGFRDQKRYADRLRAARRNGGGSDALLAGSGRIEGAPVEVGIFVFEFMGGSMGSVVGEKVTRVFERALERRSPAMVFSASGGARMQEGVLSLMQMAKTSAALGRLREAGLPYFSVLLHPTTGGVAASFAMLGDVILAEPKALIGFAGARVIQNTIRQRLPPGFQRAEFLLDHGFLDTIVHRRDMRATLGRLLRFLGPQPGAAPVSA
ncbi:MAG: acetyl-CoA carboxylase, carboxyltransferase subunit beta [Polyangia bacterium]